MTDLHPPKGLRLDVLHGSHRDALSVTENLDHATLVGTVDQRHRADAGVTLLGGDDRGPFTPSETAPALALVVRHIFGTSPHLYLSPVTWDEGSGLYRLPTDEDGPWMASGAYAYGDSRWSALMRRYGYPSVPVPLHDRHESWALYNSMSG